MTTVSTAEAIESLPDLLERREPVIIRSGEQDVAMLISLRPQHPSEEERQRRWQKFLATCDDAASALEKNLAKDGITVDEFLKDALAD